MDEHLTQRTRGQWLLGNEYSVSDESRMRDLDALLPRPSLHIPEGPLDTSTQELLRQGQNKLTLLCRYMALTAQKEDLACAMLA